MIQSNYHFECVNGPVTGQYVTLQQKAAVPGFTVREVFLDHMQAIPDQSLMKGKAPFKYGVARTSKILWTAN